jgi:hypothetical protein
MPTRARSLLLLALACAAGCGAPPRTEGATAPLPMNGPNGTVSPTGEKHPGTILVEDRVEGRLETRRADEVPVSIAWVQAGGAWRPVVRVKITGDEHQHCVTSFGPDGNMLETTMMRSR